MFPAFENIEVTRTGRVVQITVNRPHKLNAINQQMVTELHSLFDTLEKEHTDCVLIFRGAGNRAFVAGADIAQLVERKGGDALKAINAALFDRIAGFPFATLASINGFCFGGGMELALSCDIRIASETALFAQPEVNLGIIPGAGATHRLPAIVGRGVAREIIFTGGRVSAARALQIGLVSQVVEAGELDAATQRIADTIVKKGTEAIALAKRVMRLDEAPYQSEAATFAQSYLFDSETKKRRMGDFLAKQHKSNRTQRLREMSVKTICVVGAGTMGAGIALLAAQSGFKVVLNDISADALAVALEKSMDRLNRAVDKGKIDRSLALETLNNLKTEADLCLAAAMADLVIEAVAEDLELKKDVMTQLVEVAPDHAVLATNTSSLSVTEIAQATSAPERILGMHFFNPPQVIELLELVTHAQLDQDILATAQAVGELLGRTSIVVKDSPGFASSRLGIALAMEAIRMLESDVASAEDIDSAMQIGYKHPMGPLKLTDHVGLDVRLAIADYLYEKLESETFRPPELLRNLVAEGKLGKKSGQGFYTW